MRSLRILLVEDDANISDLVVELLTDIGHDVCGTANTEQDAVAAAERHSPDLMIVDVNLQGDGAGVAAMSAILGRTSMPHIFMTGGSRQGVPPGAAVLGKPFNKNELKTVLASVAAQIAERERGMPRAQP